MNTRAPATEALSTPLSDLPEAERTLLIVDDDAPLCQRLARAMERRGFVVATADGVASGVAAATAQPPRLLCDAPGVAADEDRRDHQGGPDAENQLRRKHRCRD